jgi:hypothetical protein
MELGAIATRRLRRMPMAKQDVVPPSGVTEQIRLILEKAVLRPCFPLWLIGQVVLQIGHAGDDQPNSRRRRSLSRIYYLGLYRLAQAPPLRDLHAPTMLQ